jgi:hypothetical protein
MESVRHVIASAAGDPEAVALLQHDPEGLGRRLGLSPVHVDAMRTADRFFRTEKPILDRPVAAAVPGLGARAVRTALEQPPLTTPVAVSSDTGTLLTGPTSGTYTVTSSATATSTASGVPVTPPPPVPATTPQPPAPRPPAPRPPAPRPPGPPVPAPQPPIPAPPIPQAPVLTAPIPTAPTPGVPPSGVLVPGAPLPTAPATGLGDLASPDASLTGQPCTNAGDPCCTAAIAAVVANVAVTAQTAIVALSAIAGAAPTTGTCEGRTT